jgi:hypothetical protein
MDGAGLGVNGAFAPLAAFELGRTFQWQVGTLGMGKLLRPLAKQFGYFGPKAVALKKPSPIGQN